MKKSLIVGIAILILLAIASGTYFYSHSIKEESPTATCIKAGQIYQSPAVLGKIQGECCNNMTAIAEYTLPEVNCELFQQEVGGNSICSDCGNNICESDWENKCNCPADCK